MIWKLTEGTEVEIKEAHATFAKATSASASNYKEPFDALLNTFSWEEVRGSTRRVLDGFWKVAHLPFSNLGVIEISIAQGSVSAKIALLKRVVNGEACYYLVRIQEKFLNELTLGPQYGQRRALEEQNVA